MTETGVRVVLCAFPEVETARQIGTMLVETQLAACVNLIPGVESIYRWEGAVERAGEILAVIKTTAERLPELERALAARHPYDTPEIVALRPEAVAERYAAWVAASVREAGSEPGG